MSSQINQLISPLGSLNALLPPQAQRTILRELERTASAALVARTREQARAALSSDALEFVGVLSALEGHLVQIAPLGEARYKAIVDSFVIGAASSISRL